MSQIPESTLSADARQILAELTLSPRLLACDSYGMVAQPRELATRLGRPLDEVARAVGELSDGGYMSMIMLQFHGCEPLTWLQVGRSVA